MKKRFSICLAAVLLLAGCSKMPAPEKTDPAVTDPAATVPASSEAGKTGYNDGVIGGEARGSHGTGRKEGAWYAAADMPAAMPEADGKSAASGGAEDNSP